MSRVFYDAIVIGGGPGGSSVATYLARAGKRVLVLEKEHFPRFHIGESLLPYNHALFKELGVLPTLEKAGFTRKLGAQFHIGNCSKSLKLTFRNGCFTREPVAFQVERSRFDHLLLEHATQAGADTRQGWAVTKYSVAPDRVTVEASSDTGVTETFEGAFLVDASGRVNFTGNRENLRIVHSALRKLALFAHFEGVRLDEGDRAGDIQIVRLENKWFWLIPLSPQKVSVGLVMDQDEFARSKSTPIDMFNRVWQSSQAMRDRLQGARAVSQIQTTTDFCYYNRRLAGPRLLRIGDAAGFMDPIFSAGVYMAMYSARIASKVILASLAAGDDGSPRVKGYEKRVFGAMKYYWEMVDAFYTQPFTDLFMQPRPKYHLPDAIVAILAGELDGGWKLEWRRRVFFWLVKLQARWPLVPRISFDDRLGTSQPGDLVSM